jgi:hypothetical protein
MAIKKAFAPVLIVVLSATAAGVLARTAMKLPKNRYTPQQDVESRSQGGCRSPIAVPVIENEQITGDEAIVAGQSPLAGVPGVARPQSLVSRQNGAREDAMLERLEELVA